MTEEQLYKRAIALDSKYSSAFNNLGCALPEGGSTVLENGTTMTQEQLYKRAIALDSENSSAFHSLGCALPEGGSTVLENGTTMTKEQLMSGVPKPEEGDRHFDAGVVQFMRTKWEDVKPERSCKEELLQNEGIRRVVPEVNRVVEEVLCAVDQLGWKEPKQEGIVNKDDDDSGAIVQEGHRTGLGEFLGIHQPWVSEDGELGEEAATLEVLQASCRLHEEDPPEETEEGLHAVGGVLHLEARCQLVRPSGGPATANHHVGQVGGILVLNRRR